MWLMLKDSFLSIVQKPGDKAVLTVRARAAGHIENVFPSAKVIEGAGTDYLYRATVPREEVAKAISDQVMGVNYGNFKNAVQDYDLHEAYMGVWNVMYRFQTRVNGDQ